jgi:hypothetical protein
VDIALVCTGGVVKGIKEGGRLFFFPLASLDGLYESTRLGRMPDVAGRRQYDGFVEKKVAASTSRAQIRHTYSNLPVCVVCSMIM